MSAHRRPMVALAVLGAALFLSLSTAHAQVFVRQWGTFGNGPGQFNGPCDVGVDLLGHVYVAEAWNPRVQKFSADGVYLGQVGSEGTDPGQFLAVFGIWVTPAGHLWTADPSNNRITEFDAEGNYLRHFETPDEPYIDGQLSAPFDVAVDEHGNIYVVEFNTARVQKFDATGRFVRKWLKADSREGIVGLDGLGHVYTAERSTQCVQRWSLDGAPLGSLCPATSGPLDAGGFAADPVGNLYVSCGDRQRILEYSMSGTLLGQFGSPGALPGQFAWPSGLALDAAGQLYVADRMNHRIQKFAFPPVPTQPTTWGRLKSLYR